VEKPNAERGFQARDAPADAGFGQAKAASSGRKTSRFSDANKLHDIVQVAHCSSPSGLLTAGSACPGHC